MEKASVSIEPKKEHKEEEANHKAEEVLKAQVLNHEAREKEYGSRR
jgi:hypothetical protein